MKKRKLKTPKKLKLSITGWNTTDSEEVERRQLRGQTEAFKVENRNSKEKYFSAFHVASKSKKQYHVEIRSLANHINSCGCQDYQSNQLGTCKHIEHVLFRLKKLGQKIFKQAALTGSPLMEIYFDSRDTTLRIQYPQKINTHAQKTMGSFFSTDGTIIGNPISAYSALQNLLSTDKKLHQFIRVSRHIHYFIDYQKQIAQRESAKEIFYRDIAAGKKALQIMKHNLYEYQQDGMMHLAFNERALLADEMGLGKTVQAIAACALLRRDKNIRRVLVIATASLKSEWEEQIAKFTDLNTLVIQGVRANRLKQYQHKSFFYLTNYEQVVMDGVDIQRLLSPDVIILDEAQRIKNWQTKTAGAIKQLKSRYAFVLTGTPIENRIDDIYSIMQFLDPHIFGSLFRFNRDFYTLDEKGKPIGCKNLDELHRRIRPIMLRRLKSDVEGQLPQRTVNNYFVSMEEEQRERYKEYEKKVSQLVKAAKSRPLRKEEFERMQRYLACMRMICDTPYILDAECRISPKLKELKLILEELLTDETAKIIIFSEWERMLQLVRELATQNNLAFAWHTGSVPQHKRREEINRFKNDPRCRLFLSTDSGSVGLNLQAANIVINLDLPWNPAKLEQRIARAWRKHQTRSVQVINLVCEDSIEHRMLGLLAQKQTLAQGVLEGKDNLKEMNLPSGRAAFIERMENLMGQQTNGVPTAQTTADTISSPTIPNHIDLLQSHCHPETGNKTVFAVADQNSNGVQKQLHHSFMHEAISLEVIDRHTFEIIQRLEKAGILTLNRPSEIFHSTSDVSDYHKKIRDKQMAHAKNHFSAAQRKHKMADVLIKGDFHHEALSPLHDAFKSTIQAFLFYIGKAEQKINTPFSPEFIQEHLITAHGFPENTTQLLTQLENKDNQNNIDIENLLSGHQVLIEYVERHLQHIGD